MLQQTLAVLILLVGFSTQTQVTKHQLKHRLLSLVQTEQSTRTCQSAINQYKAGSANWRNILGSGSAYSDPDYKPGYDAIRWTDYPRTGSGALSYYASYSSWARASAKYGTGVQLFSTGTGPTDIMQGSVNDCFWLSPTQSMAEDQTDIRNVFVNTQYPSEGLIAARLYVKGKPSVITIDDFLPFMSGNLAFDKRPGSGNMWGPLLEKTFAKLNGNYEAINWGWQAESWRILNGAPSRFYIMTTINNDPNQAWNIITDAINKQFLIGCDTPSSAKYSLVGGHAYTILDYWTLKDVFGNVQYRLLRIRNPWGSDSYTGPWSDSDSRWTTWYKSQVPYANSNEGNFFMEVNDFVQAFYYFTVNYYRQNWKVNYYERLNDDGSQQSYSFQIKSAQDIYIGADFYDPRMYSYNCRNGQQTKGYYQLYRGTTMIDSYSFSDQIGYGWTSYTNLPIGTYTLKFQPTWTQYDVKDYVISIYSKDTIQILDSKGQTSNSIAQDLQVPLYKSLQTLSKFDFANGGWYATYSGYYNNNTYFFQMNGITNLYNMNLTISLTSYDSTAATFNGNAITNVKNSDGSTTHTHLCQIKPKSGINDCSYAVDANNGVKWSWTLLGWNYA